LITALKIRDKIANKGKTIKVAATNLLYLFVITFKIDSKIETIINIMLNMELKTVKNCCALRYSISSKTPKKTTALPNIIMISFEIFFNFVNIMLYLEFKYLNMPI
jgi:hypothetical protein